MTLAQTDRVERHVTCLGCGCACDDLEVTVRADRIVGTGRACELGAAWFGDGGAQARALIGGAEASRDDALAAAARLLSAAHHPLVYLAADLSCEAQRAAVALADRLHAAIDNVSSSTVLASVLAAQEIGRASATLGEIRNRADVVVFWDVDGARYPRFGERYAPEPEGLYLQPGPQGRRVVSVTVAARPWQGADRVVSVAPDNEVMTLVSLGALLGDPDRAHESGPAWRSAATLAECLEGARYVAVVADAEPAESSNAGRDAVARADALCRLSHALNHGMRGAVLMLRAGGNRSGAEAAMTSAAGYPVAVDFSGGSPRYRPHDGSAPALLGARDVDAVLVLGDGTAIGEPLRALLADTPCAVIGPAATTGPLATGHVAIDSARAGVHEGGTALRMDDVTLPLRQVLPGPPSVVSLLTALSERLVDVSRPGVRGTGA